MSQGPVITASRAIEHARYTYGGAAYEFPGHVDPLDLVNEAGDLLVSMHDWEWLRDASVDLDFKAGSDIVKLPEDYKGVQWQDHSNGLVSSLTMVSPARFLELQTSGISTNIDFFGTVVHVRPRTGGPPVPSLQVFPTPGADTEGSLKMVYEAGWRYVDEASEPLTLPSWLKTVYLELLVHVTRGRLEEDQGTVASRIEGLATSSLFRAAVNRDAAAQREYGPLRRTHVKQGSLSASIWPDDYGFIGDPT